MFVGCTASNAVCAFTNCTRVQECSYSATR